MSVAYRSVRFVLELVTNGHEHLVALVANLCRVAYIVECRHSFGIGRLVYVAHERIEVTIGLTVLIGNVEIPVLKGITKTCGYAVSILPVGVISCRAVVCPYELSEPSL